SNTQQAPEAEAHTAKSTATQPTNQDADDTTLSRSPRQHRTPIWRFATLAFAAVTIALIAKIALTPDEPPINVIEMAPRQAAVLQAPGLSSTPGWVLTVDPEGNVLLNPQVETE